MAEVARKLAADEVVQDLVREIAASGECLQLRVSGQCMAPWLEDGDEVTVRSVDRYQPGDIVAYQCPHGSGRPVHRLLGSLRVRGQPKFLIMADDASRPDTLVDQAALLGRVVAVNGRTFRVKLSGRLQAGLRYCRWVLKLALRRAGTGNA